MGASVSIEDVVQQFGGTIWRLTAAYARARADREDLYQEIVAAVWRALPNFRGDSALGTYVLRIANNRGLSFRARTARHSHMPLDDVPELTDPTPGADTQLERSMSHAQLADAVGRLSPALAQSVALHLEGLSHSEIARALGITENAVGVRLNRARAALSRLLLEGTKT